MLSDGNGSFYIDKDVFEAIMDLVEEDFEGALRGNDQGNVSIRAVPEKCSHLSDADFERVGTCTYWSGLFILICGIFALICNSLSVYVFLR